MGPSPAGLPYRAPWCSADMLPDVTVLKGFDWPNRSVDVCHQLKHFHQQSSLFKLSYSIKEFSAKFKAGVRCQRWLSWRGTEMGSRSRDFVTAPCMPVPCFRC
jgi:hypothetical protein